MPSVISTFSRLASRFSLQLLLTGIALAAAPTRETQIQFLSGTGPDDAVSWDFFATAGRNSGAWSKIKVPSCWETQGFGTYGYGVLIRNKQAGDPAVPSEQGKYRTSFQVPSEWRGSLVRLVFEGSMTDTEAFINGKSAGPVHQGAFYRFAYDVSALVNYGAANSLEVTVSKESSNPAVNEAERRGDYWNFGGIFRPVLLESLPPSHIGHVAIDARADGSFRAVVEPAKAPAGGSLRIQLLDSRDAPLGSPLSLRIPAGSPGTVELGGAFPGVQLWTAETPRLYRARVSLLAPDGTELHRVTERFGFRSFEVRKGDGLYLNGAKIVLKGVNRHSFRPETARTLSAADNLADVRLMREMNMNAVRMSHYPPDRSFLEACDELGLYVLNELAGWHGVYDTHTGRKLVAEMVRRDVNHPSILFWDNGNETGWNVELDSEFAKHDPQRRPVLHPLGVFSGINTFHYRSYPETRRYLAEKTIFMPTEFLHGLFDGGHGAGLYDYWELMRNSPICAGGFLWVFADEGVVRSDQEGRIDNAGNLAPDGIVGPHHEKEGSFHTIRQVWSPVQITTPATLPESFDGVLPVENRYDFLNLASCSFSWELTRFAAPLDAESGHVAIASGDVPGPSIAAHGAGNLRLPLPATWRDADALRVTAIDPAGLPLWTWAWTWKTSAQLFRGTAAPRATVETRDDGIQLGVNVGNLDLRWDKSTGELDWILLDGRMITLRKGPRFIAARRADQREDGSIEPNTPKGVDRRYDELPLKSAFVSVASRMDGEDALVEARYSGALRSVTWRITPEALVNLDYEYACDGVVDLLGVQLSYPEGRMKSIRWLGTGPSRSWRNRTHGTTLDLWKNVYNNSIPGESFAYPEFKGYFGGWRWADFETTEGHILIRNNSPASYLGVYTPKDGKGALLYTLPETGIAFLDVIPAVRNKVDATELIGPQSQSPKVFGTHKGSVTFRFVR